MNQKPKRLIYGCMWLGGAWEAADFDANDLKQAETAIDAALECGINLFDHADIYTQGKAERVFGAVLKNRPTLRETLEIQSKCGIRFADHSGGNRYDLSFDWIIQSVDGILRRLHTEYLDCLLLHRPDLLLEVEEVARAFDQLERTGKVRTFGVSNMHAFQIERLQRHVNQPLVANQMEISLYQHAWLDEQVFAGDARGNGINYSAGLLEYCEQHHIELQAWGSMCRGIYTGAPVSEPTKNIEATQKLVTELSKKYSVAGDAIVLSFLLRFPIPISPIIGTTNPERIKACSKALNINLEREDWYRLFETARGAVVP